MDAAGHTRELLNARYILSHTQRHCPPAIVAQLGTQRVHDHSLRNCAARCRSASRAAAAAAGSRTGEAAGRRRGEARRPCIVTGLRYAYVDTRGHQRMRWRLITHSAARHTTTHTSTHEHTRAHTSTHEHTLCRGRTGRPSESLHRDTLVRADNEASLD